MISRRIVFVTLAVLLFSFPARADFGALVRAIDARKGMNRITIPFFGVVRFAVWVAQPKGVHDLRLAVFEGDRHRDVAGITDDFRQHASKEGFTPLVHVSAPRKSEVTLIYARPAKNGNRVELMVLTNDRSDTVLVRVAVDAKTFAETLDDGPRKAALFATQ